MEKQTRHYVEEYGVDHYVTGETKEIVSREEYLSSFDNDEYVLLLRFFDRDVVVIDNKEFLSEKYNFTPFLRTNGSRKDLANGTSDLSNFNTVVYNSEYCEHIVFDNIEPLGEFQRKMAVRK